LPHPADGPGPQHRLNPIDDHGKFDTRLPGNLTQRITLEALDAILRHRKNAGVTGSLISNGTVANSFKQNNTDQGGS